MMSGRSAMLARPPNRARKFRAWKQARIAFFAQVRESRGEN
jgi:hypothetical protein